MTKVLISCALIACTWDAALAFDYRMLLAPPAQSNSSTCQSYVLGVALAMAEPPGNSTPYRFRMHNEAELRLVEMTIRRQVEREMDERIRRTENRARLPRDNSDRTDWNKAIGKLTFGRFRVEGEEFLSFDEMIEYLGARAPIRSKAVPQAAIALATPIKVYFTSFVRIGLSPYNYGHIVTILGIQRSGPRISERPELLLMNSASKSDDNECLRHPRGDLTWTKDYEVKAFGGKYVLNWLEAQ